MGEHARGETSTAFAGPGQQQDTGAKMVHGAPTTCPHRVEVRSRRRPHVLPRPVQVNARACHLGSNVLCDALLVDKISRTDTYPTDVRTDDFEMGHEAAFA